MMARAGVNATLSWPDGSVTRAFGVRVETVSHPLVLVSAESGARRRRAMYPHRMSNGAFTLGLIVAGQAERVALTSFLGAFTSALLDPGSAAGLSMEVQVPARSFHRKGIPTAGMEWGMRVGQITFKPQLVFQTSWDPTDTDGATASAVPQVAAVADPAARFFFPFGTQLSGDTGPAGTDLTPWSPPAGLKHRPDPASWGQ